MKKLLTALLAIVMVLSMVSCDINDVISKIPFLGPHEHNFVLSEADSTPATCLAAGVEVKVCSCGEKQETALEAPDTA